MSSSRSRLWRAAIALGVLVTAAGASAQRSAPPPSAEKQRMIDLGIEHETARGLYDHFKQRANGGAALTSRTLPDWTGVWTRASNPFFGGSTEEIRRDALFSAMGNGNAAKFKGFAEQCMAEYDLNGWTAPDLVNPEGLSVHRKD